MSLANGNNLFRLTDGNQWVDVMPPTPGALYPGTEAIYNSLNIAPAPVFSASNLKVLGVGVSTTQSGDTVYITVDPLGQAGLITGNMSSFGANTTFIGSQPGLGFGILSNGPLILSSESAIAIGPNTPVEGHGQPLFISGGSGGGASLAYSGGGIVISGGQGVNGGANGPIIINDLNWPTNHGSAGQILTTNGSNAMSWTTSTSVRPVAFFAARTPISNETLLLYVASETIHFPADFVNSVSYFGGTNPDNDFILGVNVNGVTTGTITISSSSAVSFSSNGTPITLYHGDVLSVVSSSTTDANVYNFAITFKGTV